MEVFDGSSSFKDTIFPLVAYVVEFPSLDEGFSYTHCAEVCNRSYIHHVGCFHKKSTASKHNMGNFLW